MRHYLIAGALMAALATGCTSRQTDFCGQWSREAEEPLISLKGIETIDLRTDSTFKVSNKMLFSHSDSNLCCRMNMTVRVEGRWDRTNQGDLLMHYRTESLTVDPDSASFSLEATKAGVEVPAEIAAATYSELIDGVTNYYKAGYQTISDGGGMMLMMPQVIDSQLYARIGGQTVSWEKTTY